MCLSCVIVALLLALLTLFLKIIVAFERHTESSFNVAHKSTNRLKSRGTYQLDSGAYFVSLLKAFDGQFLVINWVNNDGA